MLFCAKRQLDINQGRMQEVKKHPFPRRRRAHFAAAPVGFMPWLNLSGHKFVSILVGEVLFRLTWNTQRIGGAKANYIAGVSRSFASSSLTTPCWFGYKIDDLIMICHHLADSSEHWEGKPSMDTPKCLWFIACSQASPAYDYGASWRSMDPFTLPERKPGLVRRMASKLQT